MKISAFKILLLSGVAFSLMLIIPSGFSKVYEKRMQPESFSADEIELMETHGHGKKLFRSLCASCHFIDQDMTGPALQGVEKRVPGGKTWIYKFVKSSTNVIKGGDPYANELFKKWGKVRMPDFPELTGHEIDQILHYVEHPHHHHHK